MFTFGFTVAAYKFYHAFIGKDYLVAGLQFLLGFFNFSLFLKYLKYKVAITYRFDVYNEKGIASCTFVGENFELALLAAYERGSGAVKYTSMDNMVLNILVATNEISYSGGAENVLVRRKMNWVKLFQTDSLQTTNL